MTEDPVKKIYFESDLNVSVQPTDILYVISTSKTSLKSSPKAIGTILQVDRREKSIRVQTNFISEAEKSKPIESFGDFYFFSKNKNANVSGLLGYYAEVEYRNNSKKAAEIFAVGTEYAPSSK